MKILSTSKSRRAPYAKLIPLPAETTQDVFSQNLLITTNTDQDILLLPVVTWVPHFELLAESGNHSG